MSSTFISTAADPGPGLRLAVKDNVDVAGLATTGGSRSLAGRPAAEADADREVQVTLEPVGPPPSPEEWRRRVLETAGKWQGPLERPEQGEFEKREPLA